jgi:hypothetical protein
VTRNACRHEQQVVNAVLSGAWPERVDEELTVHAAQCDICAEVVAVATLLRQDHEHARREVQVPAAGQVWWRAAVRARLERAHASTQPMTWLHGITAACTLGVTVAILGIAWPSIAGGAGWVKAQLMSAAPGGEVAGLVSIALGQSLVLALVAVTCLVVAPVALYFALSDE